MIELIVQSGKHQGKRLHLPAEGDVVIGRDETCQIRLASDDVSRHHCLLRVTPEGIVARDLDSRNGTYLNETLMDEETLLNPGDILRIGPIVLQVPGAPARPNLAASDADIASWLSVEGLVTGEGAEIKSGDTTVIPCPAPLAPAPPPPPQAPPANREAPRQFRSVADEAADIIRRHREAVKAQREQQ